MMRTVSRWPLILLVLVACSSETSSTPDGGSPRADAGQTDAAATDATADASEPADTGEEHPDASDDAGTIDDAAIEDTGTPPSRVILGAPDRPAPMKLPPGYAGEPLPLVVLLHGYSVNGATQDAYFGLSVAVDLRPFFLIVPDGTQEASAARFRFWNATDACCNFYGSTVDDVAYLLSLIDEASALVNVTKVYLVGHSNGGFMSYRLACDAADRIDAIVSLAGATFSDETRCTATRPISVLQIHGTADSTILYNGVSAGLMQYPGAEETVERWATRAGCDLSMKTSTTPIDLEATLAGAETEVETYRTGCTPGIEVEHWRIRAGAHIPNLVPTFSNHILDWLFAH